MPKTIKTVSEFQRKTKPTFDAIADSDEPVLVLNRNQRVGVFLSPTVYDRIVETYNDFIDGHDLEKAMAKKNQKFHSLNELDLILD